MQKLFRLTLAALAACALLASCGGGSGSGGTGIVSLGITDAPVDNARAVVVKFTGVSLKREGADEQVITFAQPRSIDLLALQGGKSESLLQDLQVPAGRYEWISLQVVSNRNTTDSYLTDTTDTQVPLFVPSGSQSGLKLVSGFTVPVGGKADFTIDFDLRKSVNLPQSGSGYHLKPALRLVDNTQVGRISGTVSTLTLANPSCPSDIASNNANLVYVFPAGTTPNDLGGTDTDAITVAPASVDTFGTWRYTAAFLPAGSYTVAFTCQGATDQPETVESLTFLGTQNVTVTANTTATADF